MDLQGPVFSHEPPHKVEFSNNTGGHIGCSGHGSPQPEVKFVHRNYLLKATQREFIQKKKKKLLGVSESSVRFQKGALAVMYI